MTLSDLPAPSRHMYAYAVKATNEQVHAFLRSWKRRSALEKGRNGTWRHGPRQRVG